ncbi:MAG: DUF4340 domain-containing protein [Kiritimatiellia bacterium]|nr:DUF4340 domain-containing protein [Kiritimatiellia bacterium]
MKLKTLIILVAIAVLFGALAYYSSQKKKPFSMPSVIGNKVLPNLAINRVSKLVITSKDGVATIAKSKEKWVVVSCFNYPANFDKVADTVRELSELKIGQTVNVNSSQLDVFNLISPVLAPRSVIARRAGESARLGEASGEDRAKPGPTGTLVELCDEKDGLLTSLLIGKSFMRPGAGRSTEMMNFGSYPDGQYVQNFDGKVYLVSKTLDRLTEPVKTWLADDFINVSPTNIKEIAVSGPDRVPIELILAKESKSLILNGLRPEEGNLDSSKVNQITGALTRLGFDDVADPALPLKETGLDRPIVFRAATKDGLIYEIRLGNTLTNDSFDRYLAVSVTNEPSADQFPPEKAKQETDQKEDRTIAEYKNVSEQAAELNAKFGPWIYIVKSYRAEPMLLARDDLIKKSEPQKTEGGQTDAPVIKAEEAGDKSVFDQMPVLNEKTKSKSKK